MREHLIPQETDRGFACLPEIAGAYGGSVMVHESSSAEYARLWLTVKEPHDANAAVTAQLTGKEYEGGYSTAMLHLDAEDAWKLADQLRTAVRNHYHGDATPNWAAGVGV